MSEESYIVTNGEVHQMSLTGIKKLLAKEIAYLFSSMLKNFTFQYLS